MPRKDDIHDDDVEERHSVGGADFANILKNRIFLTTKLQHTTSSSFINNK